MQQNDISDRMTIILTLLLTSTAFKFMYAERLPNVDYLTRLDHYMNLNLLMLLVQTSIHVAVFVAIDRFELAPTDLQYLEEAGLGCLICLWTAIHVAIWWIRSIHRHIYREGRGTDADCTSNTADGVKSYQPWDTLNELEDSGSVRSGFTAFSSGSFGK